LENQLAAKYEGPKERAAVDAVVEKILWVRNSGTPKRRRAQEREATGEQPVSHEEKMLSIS
jgi:hypothetical protein